MRRIHFMPPVVPAMVLAISACTEGAEALSDDDLGRADVVVVAQDMRYVDPPVEVAAGESSIALVNDGRAPHDLRFEADLSTAAPADQD